MFSFLLYLTRPVSVLALYYATFKPNGIFEFKIYRRMTEFYFKVSQVGAEDCDLKTASLFRSNFDGGMPSLFRLKYVQVLYALSFVVLRVI